MTLTHAARGAQGARLDLTRDAILGHRRRAGALDERLPFGAESLRRAAWAGLQDSMPRAALLSIHARVAGTGPSTLDDPALAQVWGPHYSAFVVPARDLAVFTLGRLPEDAKGVRRATDHAVRLDAFLAGRRMPYGQAGRGLGVNPNALRYGAATGRVLIRWEGARQPEVWTVPAPDVPPDEARRELARRYLHVYGPSTAAAYRAWAGIATPAARRAFEALDGSLVPVRTPVGDGWILGEDEASFRMTAAAAPVPARLLPSGDPYFLLDVAARALLVPDAVHRAALWTPRVWPGAVLLGGEIVGTWRRAEADVAIQPWRPLSPGERRAVEAEAVSMPLPGLSREIAVRWVD